MWADSVPRPSVDCTTDRAPTRRRAARSGVRHDGFRRLLVLLKRDSQGSRHEHDGIHPSAQPVRTSQGHHRARAAASTSSARRRRSGPPTGPDGCCRWACRPASRPTTRTRSWCGRAQDGVDGGRRRQPLHRLRHGLRRAVRRPLPSRWCAPRSSASSTTARCSSRRARCNAEVAELLARPLRPADVAVHQLGHRGHDGRHPRRPRRHRPGQDRQGRRRLPRPPRRGDGLDEAAARRGRSGRRPDAGAGHRRDHRRGPRPTRSSSRTTTPRRSSGCSPPATSPASSSSR